MIESATHVGRRQYREVDSLRVLLLLDDEQLENAPEVRSLVGSLESGGHLTVTVSAGGRLRSPEGFDAVLAYASHTPLSDTQEQALVEFVQRGGGLVCLGETGEAWHANAAIRAALGLESGERTPVTELVVHGATEHELTRRIDPSFAILDSCTLLANLPAGADSVLSVNWRFTNSVVAYTRSLGDGCVFYTSLGASPRALAHPTLRRLLYRAVRYVSGLREAAPVGVAMLGYGAIGYEHGTAMRETPGLAYRLVCDRNPTRLEAARAAFPDLRTTIEMDDVLRDPEIGAVFVCTPPNTHAALAREALSAGKHVVVEKPFCITTREADELIALATERNRLLTVYQNRRWDPDYLAIKRAVEQGAIGDVFHIETFIGGFSHPCDFWHSHEPISGGVFYDWGSHYLDWVLTLLPGPVRDVRASAHKRVWHDVTNADQANLSIRFEDGREASFIHSDIAALLKPKWYLLGTTGAITGHWRFESVKTRKWSGDLIEERLAPAEALPDLTMAVRTADGLLEEQRLALPPMPVYPFHRNLADALLTGEPLAVSPLSSRRNIAVMEAAAYSAAHDAEVVRIDRGYA